MLEFPILKFILERHAALGAITEVRALRRKEDGKTDVYSGYYAPSDLEALTTALQPLSVGPRDTIPRGDHPRDGEATFHFTVHGVDPEKRRGILGRLVRSARTTRDEDISVYSVFPIDVDPVRPAHVSATDEEKAFAETVATNVRAWLNAKGIPSLMADSGNGFHLLVLLEPIRGEAIKEAAERGRLLLRMLAALFGTPEVTVDGSVYNPGRLMKLYGTLAMKGQATLERPHRRASIDLSQIPPDVDLFGNLKQDLDTFRRQLETPSPGRRTGRPPGTPPLSYSKSSSWRDWRRNALSSLSLEDVYPGLLTGRRRSGGWLECRDPDSPSGDKHPSAGVADGTGEAERGSFHSFRLCETVSAFDFLISRGRASSLRDACEQIARWSGVPLPSDARKWTDPGDSPEAADPDRETATVDAAFLAAEDFRDTWAAAEAALRPSLLRAVLGRCVRLSALEVEPILATLKESTGYPVTILRRALIDLRREQKKDALNFTHVEGTIVDYVVNFDTPNQLLDAIVAILIPTHRFFLRGRDIVYLSLGYGPDCITERNIIGRFAAYFMIRFLHSGEDGPEHLRYGVLTFELARTFCSHPDLGPRLPPLAIYSRMPVFARDWTWTEAPGYHARDGGIFYDGGRIEPTVGTTRLDEILNTFPWRTSADRTNFLGVLLTAVTLPMWGEGHPMVVINGNLPGVGKTTLAVILGVVVGGRTPQSVTYTHDDMELEKRVATRVDEGETVIVIDNVKIQKEISSQVIDRSVSDARPSFRRLGVNSSITRAQNDLILCLTMNSTRMDADLRRRALPVNLHLEGKREEDKEATMHFVQQVLGWRPEVLSELLGMVLRWVAAGRPRANTKVWHSTGYLWANTIHAILTFNGLEDFLANLSESLREYDPDFERLMEICDAHHEVPPATAAGWASLLVENLLADRLLDSNGRPKSPRAQSTIVGQLFSSYLSDVISLESGKYRLVKTRPNGTTHSPCFHFASLDENLPDEMRFDVTSVEQRPSDAQSPEVPAEPPQG